MEDALSKIRVHASSSLAHQKAPATLLRALESTLTEQGTERTPTAYYAALLTTLEGTLKGGASSGAGLAMGEGDILPAELYLLAVVAPFVPIAVLRAHLNTVLSLTAPLFPHIQSHAPPTRSQLSIYGAVLPALDKTQLDAPGVRQCFSSILPLTLDPRPKVRRKAAEVVQNILAHPPAPMAQHPYADQVAEWAAKGLQDAAASPIGKHKGKRQSTEGDASDIAIHLLTFLRMVALSLPPAVWPAMTTNMLTLPRLGNPYLSQSAYALLSSLLSPDLSELQSSSDDEPQPRPMDLDTVDLTPQLPAILKAVLSSPPPRNDSTLAPSWLRLLGRTLLVLRAANEGACTTELPRAWKAAWIFVDNTDVTIRASAAESLDLLSKAFAPLFIEAALKETDAVTAGGTPASALGKIIVQLHNAFDQLSFASSIGELLLVVSSVLFSLKHTLNPGGPTAAEVLLKPLVLKIAALRVKKSFEHKEGTDLVLARAMSVLGPHVLLSETWLPLNLEPADRSAGREPRAFLLPMLPHAHPSPLGHFVNYFVPLSERMFDLQGQAEMANRVSEAKVWSVLIGQVWSGLIGYCYCSPDLPTALTPQFAQLLSQLLYGQQELRPAILKALKITVESNVAAADDESHEKYEIAQENVEYLRSQAASWLAVLFNVFGSTDRDARAAVGEVVAAWVGVTGEQDTKQAYLNVVNLFKTHLAGKDANVVGATQDLLLLLLPKLGPAEAQDLLAFCLSSGVLTHSDNGVQKRGYKLIARLLESGKVEVDVETLLGQLESVTDGLLGAAKKDRLRLLGLVVQRIPDGSMHLIPSLIPEAVLGTKETSEKARVEAFELVVKMGERMKAGGTVRRAAMDKDAMEEGDEAMEDAKASMEEYVTMLAGGLAGATPHMISASVTALSRVVFEFRDEISHDMHMELFTTLLVFLQSANREIVKATLGYMKLVIHTLPVEWLRPQLGAMVPALLKWAHPGKNAFKLKVRHVFERIIRRFGWEEVYAAAQEEEGRKMLLNVKKRKDRAKKKRVAAAQAAEEDDDDEIPRGKAATGDAFEDVLYGSESEIDSEDDDAPAKPAARGQVAPKVKHGARLRVDDDEPMDLLHGAAAGITTKNERKRNTGKGSSKFKTDEDTGRMVIEGSDEDDDGAASGEAVAGEAYKESMTSVDGFTRGPNGRIKFNKDTKKRRREEAEAEDVEMGGVTAPSPGKKTKGKRQEPRLGAEFKAKKAGGDVKKGGVDPYAYLSLSQAAKKKGGSSGRIGIAGKR